MAAHGHKEANGVGELHGRHRAHLGRGKACNNCRYLKIRCDGKKPVCGRCTGTQKQDSCNYKGESYPSKASLLQETVTRLTARARELEHAFALGPGERILSFESVIDTQKLDAHSSSSSSICHTPPTPHRAAPVSTDEYVSVQGFHGHFGANAGLWNTQPVGTHESRIADLVRIGISYGTTFGLFLTPLAASSLHSPSLNASTDPVSSLKLRSPALYYSLAALGAQIHPSTPSPESSISHNLVVETELIRLATHALPSAIDSFLDTPRMLETIQAEVLLTYYFWRSGAFLNARLHIASAMTLLGGCGLHVPQGDGALLALTPLPGGGAIGELRAPPPACASESLARRLAYRTIRRRRPTAGGFDIDSLGSDAQLELDEVAVCVRELRTRLPEWKMAGDPGRTVAGASIPNGQLHGADVDIDLAHALLDGIILQLYEIRLGGHSAAALSGCVVDSEGGAQKEALESATRIIRSRAGAGGEPLNPAWGMLWRWAIGMLNREIGRREREGAGAGTALHSDYLRQSIQIGLGRLEAGGRGSLLMQWEFGCAQESVAGGM
ncbi:Zn(2)-C6 fungal-type domain-containing protein [Mycena kentingensis (nom. inval.)]|nr:Zn(2)-C6 fungal-type domain-containing protein [Mycena kentingensis (nom. inval.)]